MSTHNPRQVIEDLRSHLAAPDRRLIFLMGAGASCAVNIAPIENPPSKEKPKHVPLIPGIDGLTEECATAVKSMGKPQTEAWDMLSQQCEKESRSSNVENLLSKVRIKIDAISEEEMLVGLSRKQLREVEEKICTTIAKIVCPDEDKIPEKIPHDLFADWVKKANRTIPLEIFTTNYDVLLERSLEASRIPIFDGFVGAYHPFFYPECIDDDNLQPNAKWIRLWKLHGSVNWKLISGKSGQQLIRSQPSVTGEMILPSHRKYDQSRKQPYMAYMDRLSRVVNSEHSLLVTCGYSFKDEHINAILYGALDNRHTANIIALQFCELKESDEIVHAASRRSNFCVIGPNACVMSGVWGEWQLTQPVDSKTCSFMDLGFDCNAEPEEKGSAATISDELKGRMRLGDFNWFCRFLLAMGGDIH